MPILIHGNSKVPELQQKNVKSTTVQQEITPSEGYDGFNKIIVSPIILQEKTVDVWTMQQEVVADTGYDGLSKVTVSGVTQYKKITRTIPAGNEVMVNVGNELDLTIIPERILIICNNFPTETASLTAIHSLIYSDIEYRTSYANNTKVYKGIVSEIYYFSGDERGKTGYLSSNALEINLNDKTVDFGGFSSLTTTQTLEYDIYFIYNT